MYYETETKTRRDPEQQKYKEKTKKVFEKLDVKKAYAYSDGTVHLYYNDGTEEELQEVDWLKLYNKTLKEIEQEENLTEQEKREQFFTDMEEK